MNRVRHAGWILAIALTLACLAACSDEADAWERIQASGVLRVGMDPSFPPFESLEGETLQGIDVDLARRLAADLGLKAEFVYIAYDGLYDALLTKRVDVLISALVVQPERTEDFSYTQPYFDAGQILVLPAANAEVQSIEDLGGRRLSVELGAEGHVIANTWQNRLAGMDVLPLNSADEALAAVDDGAADAAIVDSVSGRLYLQNAPALTWRRNMVSSELYAIVTRASDRELLRRLDEALFEMKESGEMEALLSRWLD